MKKLSLSSLLLLVAFCSQAQYFQRTGKSNAFILKTSPFGELKTPEKTNITPLKSVGFGYARMFKPGMFLQVGYDVNQQRYGLREDIDFHVLSAGFFLDKAISKTSALKYRKLCFYHAFGLLAGINYNYAFSVNDRFNNDNGELALTGGLSFYNHFNNTSKRRKAYSFHWDVLYSYGLSSFTKDARSEALNRSHVAVQLRIMKHKVVNFLK
jgi:hypothetical protein